MCFFSFCFVFVLCLPGPVFFCVDSVLDSAVSNSRSSARGLQTKPLGRYLTPPTGQEPKPARRTVGAVHMA